MQRTFRLDTKYLLFIHLGFDARDGPDAPIVKNMKMKSLYPTFTSDIWDGFFDWELVRFKRKYVKLYFFSSIKTFFIIFNKYFLPSNTSNYFIKFVDGGHIKLEMVVMVDLKVFQVNAAKFQ